MIRVLYFTGLLYATIAAPPSAISQIPDLFSLSKAAYKAPDSVRNIASSLLASNDYKWSNQERALIHKIIGDTYYQLDSLSLAKVSFQKALKGFTSSDDSLKTRIYDALNYILTEEFAYRESNQMADKAIRGYKKQGDAYRLAMMYDRKAYNYVDLNMIDSATLLSFKALLMFDSLQMEEDVMISLNNLTPLLRISGDLEMGIYYLHKSLSLSEKYNDSIMLAYNYMNLATFHTDLKVYDSAVLYGEQSQLVSDKIKKKDVMAGSRVTLARVALELENWDKVIDQCEVVFNLEINDPQSNCVCNRYMTQAYFENGQIDEAISRGKQAEQICDEYGRLTHLMPVYEVLYKAYENKRNYDQALSYLKEFKSSSDSIVNAQNLDNIARLNKQYETKLKNERIEKLERESKIRSLTLNQQRIVLVLVIVIALLIYFLLRQRTLKARNEALISEHKMLRAQMNPHFLFNALTAIQKYLFSNKDVKGSASYLSKFSKLMRHVLEGSSQELVMLEDELSLLEDYLQLQQFRFKHRFDYKLSVNSQLDVEKVKVPPMLIQPFVENAIEHGFDPNQAENKLEIEFYSSQKALKIKVRDNGKGMCDNHVTNRSSGRHAIDITNERVQVLSKTLKSKDGITVENGADEVGAIVTFELPLLT